MHPKISSNEKVKLFEKTDIRNFILSEQLDLIVVDVPLSQLEK